MKNVAASVRSRLTTQAKLTRRPFQELVQHYGLERFLYRLSISPHRDRFLLKGALMLRVWQSPLSRPTRDIDLLGFVDNQLETLAGIVRDVCDVAVEDDGVLFDSSTIVTERIKEEADYAGIRIKFTGKIGTARIPMQIDVGFGDVVHPAAEQRDYPSLLGFPAARLRTYPRETVIAEKFQAMVYLGTLNSRMKDFFDIWLLSHHFDFQGASLARAIASTFEHRRTAIDTDPISLTPQFTAGENTRKQWLAFSKRLGLESAPASLEEIRDPLRVFLLPIASALADGRTFTATWSAPGPWG